MVKKNNDGCGCIGTLLIVIIVIIITCNGNASSDKKSTPEKDKTSISVEQPVVEKVDKVDTSSYFSNEDQKFLNNSLLTGETPYSNYYGENYVCNRSQCSAIEVTAPINSDIIVIIKYNNERGDVISHAYIEAGRKYVFDLPNGKFQPFFYYGVGWNPTKDMGNGIKGGFVKDESFSKDSPQNIDDCVLSYVLQLRKDGNFQTKRSTKGEMF